MAKLKKTRRTLSEQLRDAIRNSEKTQVQLAHEAGLDPGQLSRFMGKQRSLTLESAEKTLRGIESSSTVKYRLARCANIEPAWFTSLQEREANVMASLQKIVAKRRSAGKGASAKYLWKKQITLDSGKRTTLRLD